MSKKAIVFNANYQYITPLETVIKSIMLYHRDIKFYILNEDIPQEWFLLLNKNLSLLGSEVLNVKINAERIRTFTLPTNSLHYSAYFRYCIGDVVEESRAIYLDCDIVVTDSIDELFTFDLLDYHLAAVEDYPNTTFNAGFLVIDVSFWRENNLSEKLFELTEQYGEEEYGDQGILNRYFTSNWLKLDKTYNLQVAQDSLQNNIGDSDWFQQDYKKVPKIIHYITENKPWTHLNFNRYRSIWWFYYGLSWEDILLRKVYDGLTFEVMTNEPLIHAAIFTETGDLLQVERLIQSLPEVKFHIGAPTLFWRGITDLEKYSNVAIYPCFNKFTKREILDKIDFYLDINLGSEHDCIIEKIMAKEIPLFSFEESKHSEYGMIYPSAQVDDLIQEIKKIFVINGNYRKIHLNE